MENAMRRFILALATGLLALGVQAEVIDIDTAELERLAASGVPIIDIRTQPEWEQTGIVAGSKLLTFFDERGKHDAPAWLEKVKPFAAANQPVIVICRSGNRTQAVSNFLSQQAGYSKVYNVKYGINRWLKEGRPVTQAAPILASCRADKTC
jgi:rhodanese-related sulfurtransferase